MPRSLKLLIILVLCMTAEESLSQRSVNSFCLQSKSFASQHKLKEAIQFADSAVALAGNSGNPDTLAVAYRWRSGVRAEMKDYKNALEDYMLAEDYGKKSGAEAVAQKDLQLRGELLREQEARRKDNILFNARINAFEQTTHQQWRYTLIAAVSLIALAAVAIVLFLRKRSELNSLMNQASEEVSTLRASRDQMLTALSERLKESRLMLDNLEQDVALQAKSAKGDQRDSLESAVVSTGALKAYVEDVIRWLEVGHDSANYHPEVFDCKGLTELTLLKFRTQLEAKKMKSEVYMSEGQLVKADRVMVAIVLENLISNAIKFTPQGGSISCFSGVSDGIVSVGVKDSGIGMDQQTLSGLFGKNAGRKGALGLILSKDLVERNGGRMYAESEVGKGSTFYFTLAAGTIK